MANRTQLSAPTLTVNNKTIPYIPNSIKLVDGTYGEVNVSNLTSGGDSRTKLISIDALTLVDKVSFDLPVTKESYKDVISWKALPVGQIAITISQGLTVKSFNELTMTNKPEFEFSADGKVTVEFS